MKLLGLMSRSVAVSLSSLILLCLLGSLCLFFGESL